MMDRGKPEFKLIEMEGKKSDKQLFCVDCGNLATKTADFKIEGAIVLKDTVMLALQSQTRLSSSGSERVRIRHS